MNFRCNTTSSVPDADYRLTIYLILSHSKQLRFPFFSKFDSIVEKVGDDLFFIHYHISLFSLPRIKAGEIKVVEREIEERKESMWLLRSWVQIISPGPFLSFMIIYHENERLLMVQAFGLISSLQSLYKHYRYQRGHCNQQRNCNCRADIVFEKELCVKPCRRNNSKKV